MLSFDQMLRAMRGDDANADNVGYAVPPAPPVGAEMPPDQVKLAGYKRALPPAIMQQALPLIQKRMESVQRNLQAPGAVPPGSTGSEGSATRTTAEEAPAGMGGPMLPGDVPREEVLRAIQAQDKGIQDQQALADRFRGSDPRTNYAPLLGLIDTWTGSKLRDSYNGPLSDDERAVQYAKLQDSVNSQRQKKTGDLVNLQTAGTKSDSTFANTAMRGIMSASQAEGKYTANEQKDLDKQEKEFAAEVDPSRGRQGEFGNMVKYRNKIDRAAAILANTPSGNLIGSQKSELASAIAALVSGGNQVAVETIHRFDPSTAGMDTQTLIQYITGKPAVLSSAAFVENFRDLLEREKMIAKENLDNMYEAKTARFYKLKAKRPDIYNTLDTKFRKIMESPQSAAIPTKEEMKKAQAVEAGEAPPEPQHKVGEVVEGRDGKKFKFKGGAWDDQKNWQEVK